jgi:hypothetical protein
VRHEFDYPQGKCVFSSPTTFRLRTEHTSHRFNILKYTYEGVSKSFRTGRLERELQIVQLSATRCSRVAIL